MVSCEDENEEELWVSSSVIQPKMPEIKSVLADGKVELEKKEK